jgi:hypothetical protein
VSSRYYGEATLKRLFALSSNLCAFQDPETGQRCENYLCDQGWKTVRARICHIRGLNPGSARYDESMTLLERNAYENLIVLCPNCSDMVDELIPERFTVEMLLAMKARAEAHAAPVDRWATEESSDWAVARLEEVMERVRLGTGSAVQPSGAGSATLTVTPHETETRFPSPVVTTDDADEYLDDDLEDTPLGMYDGMLDPNDAVEMQTLRAWEKDEVIPTRSKGHWYVVEPSRPADRGYSTLVIKLDN